MFAACPGCGGAPSRGATAVRDYEFRRCRDCATLFCTRAPARVDLQAVYADAAYFRNPHFEAADEGGYHGYKDYLADRAHIEAKFAGVLSHVERLRPGGDLLDVGCGPGFLLRVAGDRGWRATGIDLNPWATGYARDTLGVDARTTSLAEATFPAAAFDAVTMMDLVEHAPDPEALVAEAARITRPGGVLAVLTPDAGSPVSRALGRRWPEVKRAPEHLALFSARGLARLLGRHGFEVHGWHSIGKESDVATLLTDVAPAAPAVARALARLARATGTEDRVVDLDPRTKLCLYATRTPGAGARPPVARPARLPKPRPGRPTPDEAVLADLRALAGAERLSAWMFDQYRDAVRGRVVEVGAGIGTYSARMLAAGARELLLLEPEEACAAELERRFAADPRVTVSRDVLPDAPALAERAATCDLIVCQNVLEHIGDDAGAVTAMARGLAPGGQLTLIVPAHPRLFGALDLAYGHHRRYTPQALRGLLAGAALHPVAIHPFNAIGILGWWAKNLRSEGQIGHGSLRVYEWLVRGWRPLEERLRPPFGLSLVAHARRPPDQG